MRQIRFEYKTSVQVYLLTVKYYFLLSFRYNGNVASNALDTIGSKFPENTAESDHIFLSSTNGFEQNSRREEAGMESNAPNASVRERWHAVSVPSLICPLVDGENHKKNTQTQRADERRLACSGGPWRSRCKVSDALWPPSLSC